VDRLFGRLEQLPPPPDLTSAVLARTVLAEQSARPARTGLWVLTALVSVVTLAVAGYAAGASLVASGALDLFAALLDDLSVVAVAPSDVLDAVAEVLPWWSLALAMLSGAAFVWATGELRGGRRHLAA
jgi:hypothetical protein